MHTHMYQSVALEVGVDANIIIILCKYYCVTVMKQNVVILPILEQLNLLVLCSVYTYIRSVNVSVGIIPC